MKKTSARKANRLKLLVLAALVLAACAAYLTMEIDPKSLTTPSACAYPS